MAAKLKSILRQIRWPLLLKGAIFCLAWYFLPFWLFGFIALYLYFVPFSGSKNFFPAFLALFALTWIERPGIAFVVIFGALFYFLLLIKELYLIDRREAYEALVIALIFFLVRDFYRAFGALPIGTPSLLFVAFLGAALIGLFAGNFMKQFAPEVPSERAHYEKRRRQLAAGVVFLLALEFLMLGVFLPLDFIYQSLTIFIVLALIIDRATVYLLDAPTEPPLVMIKNPMVVVFGTLLLVVLLSAHWGL